MKTYKAFDKDLKCRGFQYEVGGKYVYDGKVEICHSGFHSCENPFDVLNYYSLCESRFAEVLIGGRIDKMEGDSKLCASEISIVAELKLPDFIGSCIGYLSPSPDDVQLATSGDYAQIANLGDYAQIASSGDSVQLASSGKFAKLATSGDYAHIATSGDYAHIATSGDRVRLATSGDYSELATSGDYSELATSGDYAQIAASGDYAQIAASGDNAIIASCGFNSKVKVGKNGTIALTRWVESENQHRVSVAYEGENGIKSDTWYVLDINGNFVECD